MIITLTQPKTITVVPQQTKTISTLTVQRMIDLPAQKIVKVWVKELPEPVVCWSDSAYDTIGQWTNTDVQNRLTELFS